MMYGWDGSQAPWYGMIFGPIMMIVFIVLTANYRMGVTRIWSWMAILLRREHSTRHTQASLCAR